MKKRSFKKHWQKNIGRDLDYLREKIAPAELPSFSKDIFPEMEVRSYFNDGVQLCYADQVELAHKYFERAIEINGHLVKSDKFRSKRCKKFFPVNRGEAGRAEGYARIMLGEEMPSALLSASANDILAWLQDAEAASGDIGEERFLSCASLKALSGDPGKAVTILAEHGRMRHFESSCKILIEAFDLMRGESVNTKEVAGGLIRIVGKYRTPSSYYPLLAFEAALILSILESDGRKKPDPDSVIERLAR